MWLAWFAGADLPILRRTHSEITFYNSLGLGVLLISCLGGAATCFSLAYVLNQPPEDIWLVGVAWAVLLACGVERLVLQVAGSRKAWKALAVGIAIRLFISVLIGFILAEPLILKVNEPEINGYLHDRQTNQKHHLIKGAKDTYKPLINANLAKLEAIHKQEKRLEDRRDEFRFLSECEAGTPSCSTTGRAGCGAYCRNYEREADREAALLRKKRGENKPKVAAIESDLEHWRKLRGEEEGSGRESIAERDGLLARIEALGSLAAAHPVTNAEAWLLRLFFISIDLLPLGIKVSRVLAFDSPYEARCAAARERDTLAAEAEEASTGVDRQRIKDQARAEKRVNQAVIAADSERRIFDAVGDDPPNFADPDAPSAAMSLDDFIESVQDNGAYENRPVDVPDELRRSALVGLALIGTVATVAFTWTSIAGSSLTGAWLPILALGLATALCAYTGGFRQAPAWAMRPILATFIAGLVLPPFIAVINVV